jgi:hypothetical protein
VDPLLTTDELARRAEQLRAPGNSAAQTRKILASTPSRPEDVDAAMALVEARLKHRRDSDVRFLRLALAVSCLALAGIIRVGMTFGGPEQGMAATSAARPSPASGLPGGATPAAPPLSVQDQARTLLPGLPVEMVTFAVPTGVAPDFMLSTPAVIPGNAPDASRCPRNAVDAALLFGGMARDWTFDAQTSGWMMMTIGSGVTIHLPGNMRAGYLVITNAPEMRSVGGPVTIDNINFAGISCP